jgi:hypothetical protein
VRYIRDIDLPLGVPQMPSTDCDSSADYRMRPWRSHPQHRVTILTPIDRTKQQRVLNAESTICKLNDNIMFSVYSAYGSLRSFQCPKWVLGAS